jgi:large subunit ribosomal protein L22
VDSGRMLKRLRPAPQGRGYRVRKRSNHVTLILGAASPVVKEEKVKETGEKKEVKAKAKEKAKTKEKSKTKE